MISAKGWQRVNSELAAWIEIGGVGRTRPRCGSDAEQTSIVKANAVEGDRDDDVTCDVVPDGMNARSAVLLHDGRWALPNRDRCHGG
ncbi:MAG: hypothetical protein WCE44_00225 [Candidatus Velthaea sp.]|jgi:hypothetical protein